MRGPLPKGAEGYIEEAEEGRGISPQMNDYIKRCCYMNMKHNT